MGTFPKPIVIYGLADPRDGRIRYVGQTQDLVKRTRAHITQATRPTLRSSSHKPDWPKNVWIRELLSIGLRPEARELAIATEDTCEELESKWIELAKREGPIFNVARACNLHRKDPARFRQWAVGLAP